MVIKICPRCGSSDIVWIIPQNWSMWECNNCNYTGTIIEVEKNVQKKIMKKWKNRDSDCSDETVADDFEDDLSDDEFEKKLDELFDESD